MQAMYKTLRKEMKKVAFGIALYSKRIFRIHSLHILSDCSPFQRVPCDWRGCSDKAPRFSDKHRISSSPSNSTTPRINVDPSPARLFMPRCSNKSYAATMAGLHATSREPGDLCKG
jgi:hypothetical protein